MQRSDHLEHRLSYACNNLCRFCREGDAREHVADMPPDAALKLLKRKRGECGNLIISGGEPTLIDGLPDIVRAAKDDFGYKSVTIETNARRAAYKKYARAIAASGADRFSVSIHGHCAALHDYLTRRPGSFAETALGIRNLIEAGAVVETRTVITRSNVYSLADIAESVAAAGVERMTFVFPDVSGEAAANALSIVPFISVAARNAAECGADVSLEGFPPCIAGKRAGADEPHQRYDSRGKMRMPGARRALLKKKNCTGCAAEDVCAGPPPEYVAVYSAKEFRPISKRKK